LRGDVLPAAGTDLGNEGSGAGAAEVAG